MRHIPPPYPNRALSEKIEAFILVLLSQKAYKPNADINLTQPGFDIGRGTYR